MIKRILSILYLLVFISSLSPAFAQKKRELMEITPAIKDKIKKALPANFATF